MVCSILVAALATPTRSGIVSRSTVKSIIPIAVYCVAPSTTGRLHPYDDKLSSPDVQHGDTTNSAAHTRTADRGRLARITTPTVQLFTCGAGALWRHLHARPGLFALGDLEPSAPRRVCAAR